MTGDGQWLIEQRGALDAAEAVWLERLARFDREGQWAADGQLSAVSWLVWRANMARSTAFDKVRVARELERRPIVAQAFRAGRLSYSAVRALTRLERPDPGVDDALVDLAESGQASIVDLERVVRAYHLYADQERPPPDEAERSRDVRIVPSPDGGGQIVITVGDVELEECGPPCRPFWIGATGPLGTSLQLKTGLRLPSSPIACPWQDGGLTDITNGCCQCPRHHRMLHHGYHVEGDPTTYLGSTFPVGPALGSKVPGASGPSVATNGQTLFRERACLAPIADSRFSTPAS